MAIAFFDFDGTLIEKDSGVICAVPSIRRGLLGPRIGARLIATYLLSKTGLKTRGDAQRIGFECYAGRTLDELRALMQTLYDDHVRGFLSEPMRERVRAHREAGDKTVIVTASAFFFAEPIARDLGIDEVIGTNMEFEGAVCSGRTVGDIVEGSAKLEAARGYAARVGEELRSSFFYTDHIVDLPLLEAVGTPVVVGPHAPLERLAKARGWPIVHHRPNGRASAKA